MSAVEFAPTEIVVVAAPIAVKTAVAARMIGMSQRHFERHVQPDLRVIYSGALRLIPTAELERWVAENSCVVGGSR